ncbi:cdc42 effector protein 2 [Narcine bancroftii]|uniref:cdc42 effector protein 2 n=1 Tax=Narcine bancroftii TaxID=1343680 RepID=UPI0038316891
MSVKTPIYLKTALPSKGKKLKLREVLSADMISPPLGDFHHKSHIGRKGESDTFGDISFLQGQDHLLSTLSPLDNPEDSAPPKPPRLLLEESDVPPATSINSMPTMSSSLDNQLPMIHLSSFQDNLMESSEESLSHDKQIVDKHQQQAKGVEGLQCSAEKRVDESQTNPSESIFSFQLDLGPSILDDILQVMDSHKSVTSPQ